MPVYKFLPNSASLHIHHPLVVGAGVNFLWCFLELKVVVLAADIACQSDLPPYLTLMGDVAGMVVWLTMPMMMIIDYFWHSPRIG